MVTDPKSFQYIVQTLCQDSDDQLERFKCFHGVGHTYVTTNDGSITSALRRAATSARA